MKKKTPQEAAEEYVAKISERQNVSYLAFIEDIKIDYIAGYEQAKKNLLEGAVEGWCDIDREGQIDPETFERSRPIRSLEQIQVVPVRIIKVEA